MKTELNDGIHEQQVLSLLRVLVVDDDQINCLLLAHLLEREGIGVKQAPDGRQALAMLEVEEFDLVFVDINMPDMTGFQLAEHARRLIQEKGLKSPEFIVVSAAPEESGWRAAGELGISQVLSKPVDVDELRSILGQKIRDFE